LVAVSSVLQRERTALKLMQQLLVTRRDDLELGQLIPVGDLFDVIAEGDEPFSDAMRLHFDNAKRLYFQKLLPMLERRHRVSWQDLQAGTADPRAAASLRNDARLLKTLLLAALVPEVESLRALTPQRLAALNHGTIKAPIPGREAQMVHSRCRDWAAEVGEIKLSEDTNPVLSIQVTGIDVAPILENAASHDNPGNRRRKVRELLFRELGVSEGNDLFSSHGFGWRGTRREVDLVFENLRELVDDSRLRGRDGAWTLVLDFPFDDVGFTPQYDLVRLQRFKGSARTLAWLPNFFSHKAQKELGTLVRIDAILTGERLSEFAGHLSPLDQAQAKALLKNQQSQLQQRLRQCLEVAYGIAPEPRDAVEPVLTPGDQLYSLDPTLRPRMPVGASLEGAFEALLDQILGHEFPGHPRFETEVRPAVAQKIHAVIQEAVQAQDQRVFVADRSLRILMRAVADPLKLGRMGETHFVLGHHWRSHFNHKAAQDGGGGPLSVRRLRAWIDDPEPMGLPTELRNLVILTFADQTDHSFFSGTTAVKASLERILDDWELRAQALPPRAQWDEAVRRMSALFGKVHSHGLNAGSLTRLLDELGPLVEQARKPLTALVCVLEQRLRALGVRLEEAPRLTTARSALALVELVLAASGPDRVMAFATAEVRTSESAMQSLLPKTGAIEEAIRTADWPLFEAVWGLQDQRRGAAERIRERLVEILMADEHALALKPALDEQRGRAIALLSARVDPPPPPTPPPPTPPTPRGIRVIAADQRKSLDVGAARDTLRRVEQTLAEHPGARLDIDWRLFEREDG
ncbi:MAG: phage resistance protein, partial [Sphingobacteriia bacterium]|nr:phage resistance protein [Sphingobacteriia bacterium]